MKGNAILSASGRFFQDGKPPANESNSRRNPPWWAWVVMSVVLAEAGWFGNAVVQGNTANATTRARVDDMHQQQAALVTSIDTLNTSVQALSVNVAVLTQRVADLQKQRSRR